MNAYKKILSVCLAAAMLLACVPVPAAAAEAVQESAQLPATESAALPKENPADEFAQTVPETTQSGTCGDQLTWVLAPNTKTLTISGIGEMYYYDNAPWYEFRTVISKVVVESGVTSIGGYAFYDCSSLSSIAIPSGVTSIGAYSFRDCSSLSSVMLPENLTSIGWGTFSGCSSLSSIELPDSVTSIGGWAFDGCSSLSSIELPASLTSIGGWAFDGCSSLKRVTIHDLDAWCRIGFGNYCTNPLWNGAELYLNDTLVTEVTFPSDLTSVGEYQFYGCTSLQKVTIPEGVLTVGKDAFAGCVNLREVALPSSLMVINDGVFSGCSSLSGVEIPAGVASIGGSAFSGCSSLSSIELPASLTSIGEYAFSGCSSLSSITLPASLTSVGGSAFYDCSSLSSIELPASLTSIGEYAFSGCCNLSSIALPAGVTSIGQETFSGCSNLSSIELPASLTSIGQKVFYNCSSLNSITFPESLTSVGVYAFNGCSSLGRVTIHDLDAWCRIGFAEYGANPLRNGAELYLNDTLVTEVTFPSDLTSVGVLFQNYTRLQKVTIPEGVTSIGEYAFSGCSSLSNITFPASLTSIGVNAFEYCSSLKCVTIHDLDAWCRIGFAEYGANPLRNGAELYLNDTLVTEVTFPSDLTSVGDWFQGYTSLQKVTIPEGVTSIDDWAFSGCSSLSSIEIPASVTSIGEYTFAYCSSLSSIEIPGSVTSIGEDAFAYCSSLKQVTFQRSAPTFEMNYNNQQHQFYGVTATVYYPADDDTWTADARQNYGGTLTWVPYGLVIHKQPESQTATEGDTVQFHVEAVGREMQYQWQLCYAGSDVWQNVPDSFVGGQTATLSVEAVMERNGYSFRCLVTNAEGTELISDPAALTVTSVQLQVQSLTASKTTADPGDVLTITAQGAGGSGEYLYKFIINDTSNDSWYKLQDYSKNNTITWKATTAGTKRIMVDIKDSEGNMVGKNIPIKVNGTVVTPLSVELKASTTTASSGDTVTFTAVAKGGSGKYSYKFIINDTTDNKWYRLQDYGKNNVITWTATTAGKKRIMVDVMDSTGKRVGHNVAVSVG